MIDAPEQLMLPLLFAIEGDPTLDRQAVVAGRRAGHPGELPVVRGEDGRLCPPGQERAGRRGVPGNDRIQHLEQVDRAGWCG